MTSEQAVPTAECPPGGAGGSGAQAARPGWFHQHGMVPLLAGAVLVITIAVYWPVLSTRAQYFDDDEYLNNNPLVQRPSVESALRFLSEVTRPSTVRGYYQPLTMISLMVDYALGGRVDDPRVFRVTSLALHGLNAALMTLLLARLFRTAWPAAFVGVLFGLHPTAVESVAWLAERKTVLSTFFALFSLLSYVGYAREGRSRQYVVCFVAYVLALLAKPTAVGLPIAMLLLDYWPLRRLRWDTVREKGHLLWVAVIFAAVTCISQLGTVGTEFLEQDAPLNRPLAVLHNNIFYVWKTFWPTNLCAFYSIPAPMDLSQPMMQFGVIGSGMLIVLLLVSWRWTRALVTGWALYFVLVLPTLGLVGFTPVLAADRFLYLPMLGLLLPVAGALAWLWVRTRAGWPRVATRAAIAGIVLVAGTGSALAARQQLRDWGDTMTLQLAVLKHAPQCRHAHHNLAVELLQRGDVDGAIRHFRAALEIQPQFGSAQYALALALARQGQFEAAVQEFRRSLELSPHRPEVRCGLASALTSLGRDEEACDVLRECVRLFPDCAPALNNLGLVLAKRPDRVSRDEARRHLSQAVSFDPRNAAMQYNLADFLAAENRPAEALEHYQRVLELDPGHEAARTGLRRVREAIAGKGALP